MSLVARDSNFGFCIKQPRYAGRVLLIAILPFAGASAFAQDKSPAIIPKGGQALLKTNASSWPKYSLKASQSWLLGNGQPFQASALLFLTNGSLLTLTDRSPIPCRIQFDPGTNVARLIPLTNVFAPAQLRRYSREKTRYYDSEGLALDELGRIYLCEEANRWIIRFDPRDQQVERLPIDWSPVKKFFSSDRNASFEGVAVGDGKLFVANERSSALIITVDLNTFKVIDHFQVFPQKMSLLGTHYSDLSWHDGHLFVLCRQHRVVLEVDAQTHQALAEFDYGEAEDELDYQRLYPVGIMEGLAVTDDFIWLATDNNGLPRNSATNDFRPTLLKCPRPDRKRTR
jgi:hypothetical protein